MHFYILLTDLLAPSEPSATSPQQIIEQGCCQDLQGYPTPHGGSRAREEGISLRRSELHSAERIYDIPSSVGKRELRGVPLATWRRSCAWGVEGRGLLPGCETA